MDFHMSLDRNEEKSEQKSFPEFPDIWQAPRRVHFLDETSQRNNQKRRQELLETECSDDLDEEDFPVAPRGRLLHQNGPQDYWFPEPPLVPPTTIQDPYDFLNFFEKGTATLTYNDVNGNVLSIHNLNLEVIAERSPIIAAAFEPSNRQYQLHLDLLSPLAALPFLRYLYTGSCDTGNAYDDVPTSLLLHAQLYFFASIFDLPELRSQALINVLRQVEFACSSPDKPIDLIQALRFSYEHVEHNRRVIDEVIEYCIQQYASHKLGKDQEFRALAYEHRPFYRDLVRACRRRGFEDEAAVDIIRLPYNPHSPSYYASMEDITNPRFQDVVHHFHQCDPFEEKSKQYTRPTPAASTPGSSSKEPANQTYKPATQPVSQLTLALRQVRSSQQEEVLSEDEGFQMVGAVEEAPDSEFVLVSRPAQHKVQEEAASSSIEHAQSDVVSHSEWAKVMSDFERRQEQRSVEDASDSDWTLA